MIAITANERLSISKAPTGIHGLDDITHGGLPQGRPTLVCGGAGCGKTLLATEFLVRGATEYGEPGVFFAFEETAADLTANVRSLGFDLADLMAREQLVVEHIHVERSEIEEAGEFDLEGLFIRLGLAIDTVGAKRVVLDTLEALFGGFDNEAILRAELRRLFRWLKDRGVTAIITAERGDGTLTRQGLEEYVSDCVILLDHQRREQVSTRLLRIVKYRGTQHGTNEYPFLIGTDGFSVLPLTSLVLDHAVSSERVSTGIERLDSMLGGGPYRGTSILLSGAPGTGKSSVAAHMADATCRAGQRCLYYSFEESPEQILRNMRSIGLELTQWRDQGLLRFVSSRPTLYGLEMHLATMHAHVREFEPDLVVVDPISNFVAVGTVGEAQAMLVRLVDFLKSRGTTALFISLTGGGGGVDRAEHLVDDRHLGAPEGDRARWRAQPWPVRAEVARHGPLEPGPRVLADRPRGRVARRVRRAGGRAHRFDAPGAGRPASARPRRSATCRSPASDERSSANAGRWRPRSPRCGARPRPTSSSSSSCSPPRRR